MENEIICRVYFIDYPFKEQRSRRKTLPLILDFRLSLEATYM